MKSSVQEYFLLIVEEIRRKMKKITLEEAFEVASEKWIETFPFQPPYSSFEGFRRFREKQVKRTKY